MPDEDFVVSRISGLQVKKSMPQQPMQQDQQQSATKSVHIKE